VERRVESHLLTNDDIAEAKTITHVPYTARTNTAGASREAGEPTDCGPAPEHSVWYRYQPPKDTGLIANTFGTSYAATLGVFRGRPGALERVGCDTDVQGNAIVQFVAPTGTTYFFQISGPARGGDLVFNLDPGGVTKLQSISPTGEPANRPARRPSLSGDGRFVAFESDATNLVPDGANAGMVQYIDVFVRDRVRSTTALVSVDSSGNPGNGHSESAFVSGDGRYVAFVSAATNLVPRDTNAASDVFVHDRLSRRTERVSVSSSGKQARGEPPTDWGVSTVGGTTTNEEMMYPTMSEDGRYVAFQSRAANLVARDRNHTWDVFVHDRVTRVTERVSISSSGRERGPDTHLVPLNEAWMTPSISGNGRFVSFRTSAANLVEGDDNLAVETFVHDRLTHATQRIMGSSEQLHLTDDDEPRYTQNEVRARQALSFDGRYVAFSASPRTPPAGNESNVFVHDRLTGRTIQVDVSSAGAKAEGSSLGRAAALSSDGRYVVFHSSASNLVPGDDNGITDVFVRDLWTRTTVRLTSTPGQASELGRLICQGPVGSSCGSSLPSISADGRVVAFESSLVPPFIQQGTDQSQVHVHERPRRVS
jgi:Tol biopolymer transport system component